MRRGATLSGAPRLPRTYVPRFRLWEQFDRTTQDAITVVVAPAGAGKTLAASGWLHQTDRVGAWLDADASCGPERLARLLVTSASEPRGEPSLVVIDDVHLLPAASLRLLDQRLNDAPDTIRLLLLSRWDLPLTRLVPELLGHYSTLRGDMLRMDDEETAALVMAHVPNASSAVVDAIKAYAQGWCAPAVLTARVVAASPDPVAAARRYARSDGRVADQVVSEVFAALQPEERHLLLCVGCEETVTATTASHLCHDVRAGETLAKLEATGLLVTRTGDSMGTAGSPMKSEACYRIHPLMTEVVRRRLVGGGVDVSRAQATVSRAVCLDIARGDGSRAFDRLVAVHEVEQAAELLAAEGVTMVMRNEGPAIAAFVEKHLDLVEARPGAWFAIALDRWVSDDVGPAQAWMDLVLDSLDQGQSVGEEDSAVRACIRLMRARLGVESVEAAVTHAELVLTEARSGDQDVWPQLLAELGSIQNWTGDLAQAEVNLTRAIELCRLRGLTPLAATATSHLACTQLMAGRERAAVEVATEALSLLGAALPLRPPFVGTRATLALLLGGLVDLPWPAEAIRMPEEPPAIPASDPCMRFWIRMRGARLALLAGSAGDAERILTTLVSAPVTEGRLPDHLRVVILVEHAFLAALASDRNALRELEQRLVTVGARGEAALVRGLLADLSGDRYAAAAAFETASEESTYAQPPCRALALVCHAQLLDAEGRTDMAFDRLRQAVLATEVRRNAVPFLGWIRQGSPAGPLLGRLAKHDGPLATQWLEQLASAHSGQGDASSKFASSTATPSERTASADVIVRPSLSPREREVLHELARGATYSDVATSLFVSENTVKTHVSSLYGKLAVSRRSQALAVARSLHLL